MIWLIKKLLPFIASLAAIYFAGEFIDGVEITDDLTELLLIALTLTLANALVKPILKLLLGPIIVITLGLGLFLVNVGVIVLLDYLFTGVTITGLLPLAYTTILVSAANLITRLFK